MSIANTPNMSSTADDPVAESLMPEKQSHSISFRIGVRQYQDLMKAVDNAGAKSVSDFTRTATMARAASASAEQLVEVELDEIVLLLESLGTKVRQLRRQYYMLTSAVNPNNI
jgi:uncharacterized protein (DUF1778 family)